MMTALKITLLNAAIVYIFDFRQCASACKPRQWRDDDAGTQADPEGIDVLVWHTLSGVCDMR